MSLQGELIDVLKSVFIELLDEIRLDEVLLHLRSLLPPICFLQRKEAVANEPSERHGNIGCGSVIGNKSRDSRDLAFQCFLGFELGKLRFGPENHWDDRSFWLIGFRIDHFSAEVPVPLLAAKDDPPLLVRLAHRRLDFCGGNASRAAPILLAVWVYLSAFAAHGREAFPLVDELIHFAGAITKHSIAHTNDRQIGGFARGVIPYPIHGDIEPLSNILRSKQRVLLRHLVNDSGHRHKASPSRQVSASWDAGICLACREEAALSNTSY